MMGGVKSIHSKTDSPLTQSSKCLSLVSEHFLSSASVKSTKNNIFTKMKDCSTETHMLYLFYRRGLKRLTLENTFTCMQTGVYPLPDDYITHSRESIELHT